MQVRDGFAAPGVEAFALPGARERWCEFLGLEHAVLSLPRDYGRNGDEFLVYRLAPPGRPVRDGRIPAAYAAGLFLQAAAACAWLRSVGLWLDDEDLADAVWDAHSGSPRLSLTRTPAALHRGGPGPPSSAVLAEFLDRILSVARRRSSTAARRVWDLLLAADASFRRPEFWVATAYRSFPELSGPQAAPARLRTIGRGGNIRRSPAVRAQLEKARALLANRAPRVFETTGSRLLPGSALGLERTPATSSEASRALRERHAREASERRAVWIAVDPDRWDALSRRAFEAAASALADELDVITVIGPQTRPRLPDEWRRELYVPCGALAASLRFYEALSGDAEAGEDGLGYAEALIASSRWAEYAADPTGHAPLPRVERTEDPFSGTAAERDVLAGLAVADGPVSESELARFAPRGRLPALLVAIQARGEAARDPDGRWAATRTGRGRAGLSALRRRETCCRWAEGAAEPARRIEWLLEAGDDEQALEEAREWIGRAEGSAERWFELSSRLASRCREIPPWLELLEAERELAGGRPVEAQARLQRVRESARASPDERRRAALRLAEVAVPLGNPGAAGRSASVWLREFPEAPAGERTRALCLEASARSRAGEQERALERLDEADRAAATLPLAERLEVGLVRAGVYSAAGRFREEEETYALWRGLVAESGDPGMAARLLAREALGLSDRREFSQAIARLQEALCASRDDAVESARIRIDLASAFYHSGRPAPAAALLEEAIRGAAASGREDLVHVARTNRIELAIDSGQWDTAGAEIEHGLEDARNRRDERRLLVALHQRARLSLRRGAFESATRDNQDAREIASRIGDRLEIGELWLEWGDLCVYSGDFENALAAYETAAADPPDRCDSDVRARRRIAELAWRDSGAVDRASLGELASLFSKDELAAGELGARWARMLGPMALPVDLRARVEAALRRWGAERVADRAFGPDRGTEAAPGSELRAVRDALARALAGQSVEADVSAAGLTRLALRDASGREIAALGARAPDAAACARRIVEAGACEYELVFWPPPGPALESALVWTIETLLYRPPLAPARSGFEEGWRKLGVITADTSMEEPYRRLVRFAAQPVTVLVRGESGTGKEAVARAVHALSPRAAGAFLPVNVPAIPAALLESELFGHVKGAFTGADRDRPGLLEAAAGGTIFFDEIADLAPALQSKLLRALQDREIRRVGENRTRRIDVRVVSATSRDLAREVESGGFREDLFYRLNVALILLPPLRERGSDARLLAGHFLAHYAREYGRRELQWEADALAAIAAYPWPGNVRELQNAVAQAAALVEEDGRVRRAHLPEAVRHERTAASPAQNYRARVDAHRRGLISEALQRAGGNRTRAARELGLSRQALAYLIRELRLAPRAGH